MRRIGILAMGVLVLSAIAIAEEEKRDPREDQVIDLVMSNPAVSEYVCYMSEKNAKLVFYVENEKEQWAKGKFDVYVGESGPDMNYRFGAYSFDYFKRQLTTEDLVEGGNPFEVAYNKLLFAKIEVDSHHTSYTAKPLTDYRYAQNFAKPLLVAWASAETKTEHWIKATFDSSETIESVMLFWAFDKGKYYESKDIQLLYLNSSGDKVEIENYERSNDTTIEESYRIKDSDLRSTKWTFSSITTTQLIIKQKVSGGSKARPELMWIHKAWAY